MVCLDKTLIPWLESLLGLQRVLNAVFSDA